MSNPFANLFRRPAAHLAAANEPVAAATAAPQAAEDDLDGIDAAEVVGAVNAVTVTQQALGAARGDSDTAGTGITSAPVAGAGGPVRLAVITGHTNSQFARILSGVVCRLKDDKICIDPLYKDISYFFTLTGSELAKDDDCRVEFVEVDDELAAREFLANMIQARGDGWAGLYDQFGANAGAVGVSAAMVAAEKANVKAGVQRALAHLAVPLYEVPVKFPALLSQWDRPQLEDGDGMRKLLEKATVDPTEITRMADADGVLVPATLAATDAPDQALSDEVRAHAGGFEFKVDGVIKVYATSPERAEAVYNRVRQFSNTGVVQNVLTPEPRAIQNATLTPAESDGDADDFYDRDC